MLGRLSLSMVVLFFSMTSFASDSGQIEKGRVRYAGCIGCHGEKGVSPNPLWPNLAGQKPEYIVKQLEDFIAERRKDPVMGPMAKTLNSEDMKNIAAFLSSL